MEIEMRRAGLIRSSILPLGPNRSSYQVHPPTSPATPLPPPLSHQRFAEEKVHKASYQGSHTLKHFTAFHSFMRRMTDDDGSQQH